MASPPFDINQSIPGDNDIVSQHPANARTMRDIVESWLLINHDTNGKHFRIDMPQLAEPASPAAGVEYIYNTTTGRIKIKHNNGTVEFIGLAPGIVVFTAGALDVGYLEADGSAVSRATFADLFGKIGTTYGPGDGATTFNLPDIKGRMIAALDSGAGRLTATGLGTAAILAATGGLETTTIINANLPAYTPSGSISLASGTVGGQSTGTNVIGGGINVLFPGPGSLTLNMNPQTFTGNAQGGTSTPMKNMPPTIVLRAMIKY